MFTINDIADMFRRHADRTPYGLGLYMDFDDPKDIVLDGAMNLSAFVKELNERVQKE